MVDAKYVQNQLDKIKFGAGRVNRAEVNELHRILLDDEKIYECVNGFYEGGVALLVATDIRVLLIDKKPMGFLNVDDMRFDMISDIDYSHRIVGAQIGINCGMRNLVFKSYNQQRLRKLIGHVQQRMSEIKRELNEHATVQKQHLEEINKQLQMYLLAQQQTLEKQLSQNNEAKTVKPTPQLADYLFAQRLLEEFHGNGSKMPTADNGSEEKRLEMKNDITDINLSKTTTQPNLKSDQELLREITEAGRREVFGETDKVNQDAGPKTPIQKYTETNTQFYPALDVTPFRIACAKLPYLLKTRRYRKPFSANLP